MLVVPNVMGICFWSPPLDEMGNTVRGVQFCEEFVKIYNFHAVSDLPSVGPNLIKLKWQTKAHIKSDSPLLVTR